MSSDHALWVPPDEEAAFGWLLGRDVRPVRWGMPDATSLATEYGFVRIASLAAFWEERGPNTLTTAIAMMLDGLWRLDRAVLVCVVRVGEELLVSLGIRSMTGAGARTIVRGALPGSVVDVLDGAKRRRERAAVLNVLATDATPRVAVTGVPGPISVPRAVPLLERLATADVASWALVVHAAPVPVLELLDRYDRLRTLRRSANAIAHQTQQVTPTRSQTVTDVHRAMLVDLLGREEQRTLTGVRQGAFAAQSWILAPSFGDSDALAAIAVGCLGSRVGQPLPASVRDSDPRGMSATTLLLSSEVASIVQPPAHDVMGLAVRKWARFDETPEPIAAGGFALDLGRTDAGARLRYPTDAVPAHVLVVGQPGTGKTTFIMALRKQLHAARPSVPSLVIEPAKQEYADSASRGAIVWRIGDPADDSKITLNPFEVPAGVPVSTHIKKLMALLESTMTLFSPLPEVLELALRRSYEDRGWDLASDVNVIAQIDPDHALFPTLADVLDTCNELVPKLRYAPEVEANVGAALRTRLGSLVGGTVGEALQTSAAFPLDRLLARDAVINLDAVGDDEEKAFIIGLLLIRIWAARRGQSVTSLRHLTVLEEAHRILARGERHDADGRAQGTFAREAIANLLAEIRATGEGVVVVDQSPRKIILDALANTALKIAFRTTLGADKDELAAAMNLDDAQRDALTGLERHEIIVFWEGMDRPVRARAARELVRAGQAIRAAAQNGRARRTAARLRLHDDRLDALAGVAAATQDERRGVLELMRRRSLELMPPSARALADNVVEAAVHDRARTLARKRRWPREVPWHELRGALLDGRGPLPGCRFACPHGGCLTAELVAPVAAPMRRNGDASRWAGLPADAVRQEARAAALDALAGADAPSVLAVAAGCVAVHVLAGATGDAFVRDRVTAAAGA